MWTRALVCATLLAALAVAFGTSRAADPPPPPLPTSGPPPINVFDPQPPAAAEKQLAATLKEVRFDRLSLDKALDGLRDAGGINLAVNWKNLEAAGIDVAEPVSVRLANVTVAEALTAVCQAAGSPTARLTFAPVGNLVFLSTGEDLSRHVVTRIYDVADLILLEQRRTAALRPPPPATRPARLPNPSSNGAEDDPRYAGDPLPTAEEVVEQITGVIMETVDADTWREAGGSIGWIREMSGRLIITQTETSHRRVEALLNALRQSGVPHPPATSRPTESATAPAAGGREAHR